MDDSDNLPDSNWTVEFMKFDMDGRPIGGTSWTWQGATFNAMSALEKALDAMVDAMPEEALRWRCVRIAMDDIPVRA